MKKNKEIKTGDKIWYNSPYLAYDSYYTAKSVKKKGTLVEVVVETKDCKDKPIDIVMYGHASSTLLSGYDKRFKYQDTCYTCDYHTIEDKTYWREHNDKYIAAGKALLDVAKYFK